MLELKKILVATDFSEFGDLAVRYGEEFGKAFQADLNLLNVVEAPAWMYGDMGITLISIEELEENLISSAMKQLEESTSDLDASCSVERVVIVGNPFMEIVNYAKDNDIDLIILGTHGRRAVAHLLMGSTAERVVRMAPCPVLTVRKGQHQFVMP